MKLALEIPRPHLEEFSKLTDVDFALAHMVLEDKVYAEFYLQQSRRHRRVILDNGMHENGNPMNTLEILEAASRINPTVVIPPDKIGDGAFTYEKFHEVRKHPQNRWQIAMVIQGKTHDERAQLLMDGLRWSQTIMLPYREPRTDWIVHLIAAVPKHIPWPPHLHLLGVNTLNEIRWFGDLTERLGWPRANVCVDTAKPIKWAMKEARIDELGTLRGGGVLDHSKALTPNQKILALYNIAVLRLYTS